MTSDDLARRFLASRGEGSPEGMVPRTHGRRMAMALRLQELNGAVRATREPGKPVLWELDGE